MVCGAPGLRSSRAAHSNATDLHLIAHNWTEICDVGYTAWEQRHSFPHSRNNICRGWRGASRKGKGPHVPIGYSLLASGWLLEAGRDGSYLSGSTPAVDQLQIHFRQAAGPIDLKCRSAADGPCDLPATPDLHCPCKWEEEVANPVAESDKWRFPLVTFCC